MYKIFRHLHKVNRTTFQELRIFREETNPFCSQRTKASLKPTKDKKLYMKKQNQLLSKSLILILFSRLEFYQLENQYKMQQH